MAKGQIKQAQAKINQEQFENLCRMQCIEDEIVAWFKISRPTLTRWCNETYGEDFLHTRKRLAAEGTASLRRAQFYKATTGKMDTTMLIWLGKQYLGQTDKIEAENVEKVQIVNDVKCEPTDR